VLVVIHLDDPPRVATTSNGFSVNHDIFLGTDERKGHQVLQKEVCQKRGECRRL
jgi:hypothetical protein